MTRLIRWLRSWGPAPDPAPRTADCGQTWNGYRCTDPADHLGRVHSAAPNGVTLALWSAP